MYTERGKGAARREIKGLVSIAGFEFCVSGSLPFFCKGTARREIKGLVMTCVTMTCLASLVGVRVCAARACGDEARRSCAP